MSFFSGGLAGAPRWWCGALPCVVAPGGRACLRIRRSCRRSFPEADGVCVGAGVGAGDVSDGADHPAACGVAEPAAYSGWPDPLGQVRTHVVGGGWVTGRGMLRDQLV